MYSSPYFSLSKFILPLFADINRVILTSGSFLKIRVFRKRLSSASPNAFARHCTLDPPQITVSSIFDFQKYPYLSSLFSFTDVTRDLLTSSTLAAFQPNINGKSRLHTYTTLSIVLPCTVCATAVCRRHFANCLNISAFKSVSLKLNAKLLIERTSDSLHVQKPQVETFKNLGNNWKYRIGNVRTT